MTTPFDMTWQPIATAPKDRRVLLYYPQRFPGVVCGVWQEEEFARCPKPHWVNDRSRIPGILDTRAIQPTHWMDLPDAPPQ
jgi:hypothetical protein